MPERTWTCKRVSGGIRCGHVNPRRKQLCEACGKRRPKSKKPAHMAALDAMTYAEAVAIFGARCGVCGALPKPGKRLARDHEHVGDGFVRGVLCFQCNRKLGNKTLAWLRLAVAYMERAEARKRALEAALSGQGPGDTASVSSPRRSGSVKETAPTGHSASPRTPRRGAA